jgi:hypothetical protein
MVTLEIYGKFITWPEDFALFMMKHYQNRGVPIIVHRDDINTGHDSATCCFRAGYAAIADSQVNIFRHRFRQF